MVNRLREFREKKGWTQAKLSDESGVSRTTIINLERGNMLVAKTDTLTKIADSLGGSVTEIFFCGK